MVAASTENKHSDRQGSIYRGRFAPSPTGELHFGSLLAAVGSFLQARSRGGQWLLRIEDIDTPREVPGAAASQIATLEAFGMRPDQPVAFQSRSALFHSQALAQLRALGLAFDCGCSRSMLPGTGIYPGTCRAGLPAGRPARSVRFRVPDAPLAVHDRVFGNFSECLPTICGDFVIRRADGLFAYQLAVVVDDLRAGITEVVRGQDLLESTGRQQALYAALGSKSPDWLHLPLVVDRHGRKLSKSGHADPVARLSRTRALGRVLQALGHQPPPGLRSLEALWSWAIRNWQVERIPREPFELS
ncbi:MAG: tRNA glutamyl-Q(34) synthetase GluQRS [Wenzhouxiangellaceae bacterium]|nr:tRNA glutamyl-Q(34) synthetase GluQRS [Wenzhouxiangellaceae bacterium]